MENWRYAMLTPIDVTASSTDSKKNTGQAAGKPGKPDKKVVGATMKKGHKNLMNLGGGPKNAASKRKI